MPAKSPQNTKTRSLIVLGAIIAIIVGIILYFVFRKPTVVEEQQTRVAKLPQITAVPGGQTSERYKELQEEENKKRAEEAKKQGTSAVATIIGGGQGGLAGKETFGIEDQLCKCPGEMNAMQAAKLIAEIEKDPRKAAALLKANPGLAKAMCRQKPELALKLAETDDEAAKILLKECPDLAKTLFQKDPNRLKQLLLKNPDLAKKFAEDNPDLMKSLILSDPAFANQLAATNPDVIKDLMKGDSEFAKRLAAQNPDLVKKLMRDDPTFARLMAKQNPDMVKKLMLDDPSFAKDMARDNPDMIQQLMKDDPEFAKALKEKNPGIDQILTGGKALTSAERDRLKALEAQIAKGAAVPAQLNELQQKQLQALVAAMDGQTKDIFKTWNEVHNQQFVAGDWAQKQRELEEQKKKAALAAAKAPPPNPAAVALKNQTIKAGTVLFAILETAVNSDEPGPVQATVVGGPFKGAKLLGTMSTTALPGGTFPERVTLNFNLMNVPTAPVSFGVQAVAIDPDTARTALATSVDHYYLLRYGGLLASSLMQGYSKVITSMGTVQDTATNGQSVRTQSKDLNSRQQLFAALGQVGQTFGQVFATYQNRPYTVYVEAGTSLGILFLSDVNAKL